MQRREFLRTSCTGCASLLGASVLLNLLNSCSPLPVLKTSTAEKKILIPLSTFQEGQNLLIVKVPDLEFDILLVRKKDGSYNALYMQCTHQNQPLSASKSGLFCSSHGSAFDLEGNVTIQPANQPLRKFKTETESNNLKIYLT